MPKAGAAVFMAVLCLALVATTGGSRSDEGDNLQSFYASTRQLQSFLNDVDEYSSPDLAIVANPSPSLRSNSVLLEESGDVTDGPTLEKQIAKLVASMSAAHTEYKQSRARISRQIASVNSIVSGSSAAKTKVLNALSEEAKQLKLHYKAKKKTNKSLLASKQRALKKVSPASPYIKAKPTYRKLKKKKKKRKNAKKATKKLYKKYGAKIAKKLAKTTKFKRKVDNAKTKTKALNSSMRTMERSVQDRNKREKLRRKQAAKGRTDKLRASRAAAKRRRAKAQAKARRARKRLQAWKRRVNRRKRFKKKRAHWRRVRQARWKKQRQNRARHQRYLKSQFASIRKNAEQVQQLAVSKQALAKEAVVEFKLSLKDSARRVSPKLTYMQSKLLSRCTAKIDKAAKLIGKYNGKCNKLTNGSRAQKFCKRRLRNYKRAWQKNNAIACKGVPPSAMQQACNSLHQTFSKTVGNKFSRCASLVGHAQALCFWKVGNVKAGYKHMKKTCKRLVRAIGSSGGVGYKSINKRAKRLVTKLKTRMTKWSRHAAARAKLRAKRRRQQKLKRYLRRMRKRALRKRRKAAKRARKMKARRKRELRKRRLHSTDRRKSKKAMKQQRHLNAIKVRNEIRQHFRNQRQATKDAARLKQQAKRQQRRVAAKSSKALQGQIKDLKLKLDRRKAAVASTSHHS